MLFAIELLRFGKVVGSQSLIAAAGEFGLTSVAILSYFSFQRLISLSINSGDGRSCWYVSMALLMSTFLLHITDATSPKSDVAVIARAENDHPGWK